MKTQITLIGKGGRQCGRVWCTRTAKGQILEHSIVSQDVLAVVLSHATAGFDVKHVRTANGDVVRTGIFPGHPEFLERLAVEIQKKTGLEAVVE